MKTQTLVRESAPTNWIPCLAMLAVSLISYVDRTVLSILSPTILKDLHLTATEYGTAISLFSLCYMLGNPVWGFVIDRVGLSPSIVAAVAIWSIASGAHGFVGGLAGLCLARGILGFGEGATFPAGLTAVTETLPKKKRALGLGLAYSGGSLGAAITPLIVTPLAMVYGWHAAFFFTACLGFIWIVIWIAIKPRYPKHAFEPGNVYRLIAYHRVTKQYMPVSEELADQIERGEHDDQWSSGRNVTRARRPRLSASLFATAAAYGLGALPLAFGLYAAPLYLTKVLHTSQSALGHLLWIPPLGWEAGYLFWGFVVDRSPSMPKRPLSLFVTLCVIGSLLLLIPYVRAISLVMLLFFVSMFVAGGFVVVSLSVGMQALREESGGFLENPGFLAGFCAGTWSLVVASTMPVIGKMFDNRNYPHAFWLVSALPILGTIIWSLLNSSKRNNSPIPESIKTAISGVEISG